MQLPDMYVFRKGKSHFHRRVKDIDYVEGDGDYSAFHFIDGGSLTENGSIGTHWENLHTFIFFKRIHRSYVVNLKAIRGTTPDGRVLLKSGAKLLCSSKQLPALMAMFPIVGE